MKKLIAEGAEAKIYLVFEQGTNYILKERIPKEYRAKELDDAILKKRIKSEARILINAKNFKVNCPEVYGYDGLSIKMEYLNFPESKVVLKKDKSIMKVIAKAVLKMHEHNIVHGDLTLCNILYDEKKNSPYFIDFGLANTSKKIEDKAMDLEVLREIVVADFSEEEWKIFEKEYSKKSPDVIKQMEKIQKRKKYIS